MAEPVEAVEGSVPELVEGYFGDYPPDFFDFIVIDECHRGGANDESNWRAILDYFAPAVQLGLTATPKRKDNVDTTDSKSICTSGKLLRNQIGSWSYA